MACEEHRAGLSEFLGQRGFLRESVPADVIIDLDADAARDRSRTAAVPAAGAASQPR
jgi:hypothetical protein